MQTTIQFNEKILVGEIQVDYKPRVKPTAQIRSSQDAHDQLTPLFERINYKEEFYMLLLNRNNQTLGWAKISEGGIAGTIADPKLIFQHALLAHASSIIVAHNHPSGNLKPSQADRNITKKIHKAGCVLDIILLDHLILTSEGYFSFGDEGQIEK